jgi:hypothetical protein
MIITGNEIVNRLPIAKTFDIGKLTAQIDSVIRQYLKPRLGLEFYGAINADRISLGAGSPFAVYNPATAYTLGDTIIFNNVAFECIATPPAAGYNPTQVLYWAYYAPFTTAKYRNLWMDGGLFDFICNAVLLESLPFIHLTVQSSGVSVVSDSFGNAASNTEVERLLKTFAERTESGWVQVYNFLTLTNSALSIDNPTLYPLFSENCKRSAKGNAKFGIIF